MAKKTEILTTITVDRDQLIELFEKVRNEVDGFIALRKCAAAYLKANDEYNRASRAWEDCRFNYEDRSDNELRRLANAFENATAARITAHDRLKNAML